MEMCLIGHWISESLIVRWAELTHEISCRTVAVKDVIDRLLVRPEEQRDVQFARNVYSYERNLTCVWTEIVLGNRFAVDHTIPFSIWRNNDLWNLVPTSPSVNSAKSDKLVSKRLLLASKHRIIHYWESMKDRATNRFVLEMRRSLLNTTDDSANWQEPAFAGLVQNVETLAMQRGLVRREP
jgi:hypothetical protein